MTVGAIIFILKIQTTSKTTDVTDENGRGHQDRDHHEGMSVDEVSTRYLCLN